MRGREAEALRRGIAMMITTSKAEVDVDELATFLDMTPSDDSDSYLEHVATDMQRHIRALLQIIDVIGGYMSTEHQQVLRDARSAVGMLR